MIETDGNSGTLTPLRDKASHLLRQFLQQHTSCWQHELPDLTKPRYAVMRAIAERPGIEQADLTEAAVCTKIAPAEMLSRMEKRELVRREHDPADKHRRFVYLTAQEEELLASATPLGGSVGDELLGRLSDEEREQFTRLVRRMMN